MTLSPSRLRDPDVALAVLEKRSGARTLALAGAAGGYGAHQLLGGPLTNLLSDYSVKDLDKVEEDGPIPIEDDAKGAEVAKWIQKFKKEHPKVKNVPVFVSGRVPGSVYVRERYTKNPKMKAALKEIFGVDEPGVYLRERSAAVALHEMGHAAIEKTIPNVSLLTHGTSLLALPLLGYAIFRRPGGAPKFLTKYAPAISAALQVPFLAEEAAASIIAEKTLRSEGESGKKTLVPAFLSHVTEKAKLPLATGAALFMKRLVR